MSQNYSPPQLTLPDLKKTVTLFGFEEKLETGVVDVSEGGLWTEATTDTAAVAVNDLKRSIELSTGATQGSTASLILNQVIDAYGNMAVLASAPFGKFTLEFKAQLSNISTMQANTCLYGMILDSGAAVKKGDNNVVSISTNGTDIFVHHDIGGTDTDTKLIDGDASGHLYRLEIGNGEIKVYVDGELKTTISSSLNVSNVSFYHENDAASECKTHIRSLRGWFE